MREALLKAAMVLVAAMAAAATAPSRAQGAAEPMLDGRALFLKNCAACHQATGKGIAGAFPALAGNKFVQGPGADVATVLLKGRGGMPDFSDSLSDRDIATVLSYVRGDWGNKAGALTEAEVLATRDTLGVDHYGAAETSNKH
jgi:mono/diheme cytochrome c family protein